MGYIIQEMTNNNLPTKLLPFCWHFIKNYPLAFSIFFAAPLTLILEAVVMPYALKIVIDAFIEHEDKRATVIEEIAPALWLGIMAWITLIILLRLQEWWQIHILPRFEADIRMSVTQYLMQHSHNYFAGHLSGNLASKVNDLPRAIDSLGMSLRWQVIGTLGVVTTILVILSFIHPLFALMMLIWVLVDLAVAFSFVHYINNAAKENSEDKSQLSGRIVDSISNIVATKLFARRFHEMQYVQQAQDQEIKSNAKLRRRICLYRLVIDLPVTVMWIIVGYMMVTYWQQGIITTGEVVFIFNSIWAVMFRLWFLGEELSVMFKDYGTASQALAIITTPHDVTDKNDAKALKINNGEIEFRNVTFHYHNGEKIFNNKNVVIKSGEKVGLVGFSGSGKSSFVNLILRFFDVESGTITIDGQNITDVTQESLRESISIIPQDTNLFHRTLIDNIRYGNIGATDEEVIKAAKHAHCHEFIKTLPDGYASLVGERGIKLSGGQRQRIAIARAMLKNAPILILDEATSALDSVTEKQIQEGLRHLMEDSTAIIIAHRLSTLSEMDRILVFDKGRIIEEGNHQELLRREGHYARMWTMQAGGFMPEVDQ